MYAGARVVDRAFTFNAHHSPALHRGTPNNAFAQMSARYDTEVVVQIDGHTRSMQIGAVVDQYMSADPTLRQHDVESVSNLRCVGVTPTGYVGWASVTHVSRHPVGGDLLCVSTRSGRQLTMTASHSFLVRKKNRVTPLPGNLLRTGDALPIVMQLPSGCGIVPGSPTELTSQLGCTIGAAVACGGKVETEDVALETWYTTHFGRGDIPCWMLDVDIAFITGFLRGFCGTNAYASRRGISVTTGNRPSTYVMLHLCLARMGITSAMCGSARIDLQGLYHFSLHGPFDDRDLAAPAVPDVGSDILAELSHYVDKRMQNALQYSNVTVAVLRDCLEQAVQHGAPEALLCELRYAADADVFWDPIVCIERIVGSSELVYDFTVDEELQSFMLSNGVFVHNTLNTCAPSLDVCCVCSESVLSQKARFGTRVTLTKRDKLAKQNSLLPPPWCHHLLPS